MRPIGIFIMVVLLAGLAWAEHGARIVPGKGVPGLAVVGESFSGTVKKHGTPKKQHVVRGRTFCYYETQGFMVVSGLDRDDRVWMVQLFSPEYATSDGLRVGATRAQVEKLRGKDYTLHKKADNTAYQLIYPQGIAFAFDQQNKVISINVMRPN